VKIKHIAAAVALGLCSMASFGADNVFRIGYADITVHSSSADLTSNGPAFLTPQPAGLTVADASTLVFGYTRNLDANWSVEALLGVPPKHKVNGRGTLAPFGTISEIKQFAPTFMLNYNFGKPGDQWRPFVGVGVNYTHFYDSTSTAAGNLASGGPTKINLTNSTGLAGQAGVTYALTGPWSVTGSVAAAKVKTDLTASTGSIDRKTSIDLKPLVYTICVGYAF
jgi:outer membrane protein